MEEVGVINVEHNHTLRNKTILEHDAKLIDQMVTVEGDMDM